MLLPLLCTAYVDAQGFKLTPHQIKAAQLDHKTAKIVEQAVDIERLAWASGSVSEEKIYTIPPNSSHLQPGSLISLEENAEASHYDVPAGTSLTRFTFVSQNLNGTSVPGSAYILWPFVPRKFPGIAGIPLVAWAHGSSGWLSEEAPSHLRNLSDGFGASFPLAQQGYAVVAPDYAGLGVAKDARGRSIVAQWLASPASANDLAYAIEAAREAYPQLSKKFVVFGHSQGGAAAWAFAQRQATKPVRGHLGTIAAAPVTSVERQLATIPPYATLLAVALAHQMKSIFPDFKSKLFLTELGLARNRLFDELRGGQLSGTDMLSPALFSGNISRENWQTDTYYTAAFDKLTRTGEDRIAGPLLVIQGTADTSVNHPALTKLVRKFCKTFPQSNLEYAQFQGLEHNPTLYGSQLLWSRWIADRFKGRGTADGCISSLVKPLPGRHVQNSPP